MAAAMQVNKHLNAQASMAKEKDQYLAFGLGGESFAMGIRAIKEVIQFGGITAVPLMPDFIRGVINLRGAVVPVIDLSVRFGRPPTDVARRTCIVVLDVEHEGYGLELGVIVDTVSEVLEIAEADIEPTPSFGCSLRSEFLVGVGKVGGKFVILLDVDHVLSIGDLASLAGEDRGEAVGL